MAEYFTPNYFPQNLDIDYRPTEGYGSPGFYGPYSNGASNSSPNTQTYSPTHTPVSYSGQTNPFSSLASVNARMALFCDVDALIGAALEEVAASMDEQVKQYAAALFTLAEQVKMVSGAMNALNSVRALNAHKDNKTLNKTEYAAMMSNLGSSLQPLFAMNPELKTQFDKINATDPAKTSSEDMNRMFTLIGETLQNTSKSLQIDQQRLSTELQQLQQQKQTAYTALTNLNKKVGDTVMAIVRNI